MEIMLRSKAPFKTTHPPMYSDVELVLENTFIEYPNYVEGDTYVVSGPLGKSIEESEGRGFQTIKDAADWVVETYGGYYERIRGAEPYRWAFRVRKGSHNNVKQSVTELMGKSARGEKVKFRVV